MNKVIAILILVCVIPMVCAAGDRWDLIFSDGTTTLNGTDVCLDDGTCLSNSAAGVTDTNETTRFNTLVGTDCGAGNYSYGFDSNGLIKCREDITGAGSDTNASTACSTTEVLLGNGTCLDSDNFYDTYTNGTGINLTGTIFSIAISYFTDRFIELTDSFGGDVSGTYDAIVVKDDSHTHAYQNITNEPWIEDSQESNLNVNSSDNWDNLDTPMDITEMNNFTANKINATCCVYLGTIQSTDGNSISVQPTGDVDDFFSFKTPNHRPTIKREGGKFIYIESSNVYDVGISARADDTYSGTINYEKDNHIMTLLGKNSPIGFKPNSEYYNYILLETFNHQPQISVFNGTILKINDSLEVVGDINTTGIVNATGKVYSEGIEVLTSSSDTNASTACSGSTTYLDGEGNCDDISGVYAPVNYGDDWNKTYADGLYADISVTDTNETIRFNTLVGTDCGAGNYSYGFDSNGLIQCREDEGTIYTGGNGITITGTEINHTDTSSQASSDNSENIFIQDIVLDTFGHITSIATASVDFASYVLTTDLVGLVGNWSADKSDYSTTAEAGVLYATIDEPLWTANLTAHNTSWSTDTTYSAGNGVSVSSEVFSVAGNTALTQDADGLSVTADGVGDTQLEYNTGQHLTTTSNPQFNNVTGLNCLVFSNNAQICGV